jgi:hypothetical protein
MVIMKNLEEAVVISASSTGQLRFPPFPARGYIFSQAPAADPSAAPLYGDYQVI